MKEGPKERLKKNGAKGRLKLVGKLPIWSSAILRKKEVGGKCARKLNCGGPEGGGARSGDGGKL